MDDDEIALAPTPENIRSARLAVRLFLADPVPVSVAETAVLLASELFANAVLYACTDQPNAPILLKVTHSADHVRVEVHDHSSDSPVMSRPEFGPSDQHGMILVDTLSTRWGVTPLIDGKFVWFEIDL